MKTVWNLSVIYQGLTDPAYEADVKLFEEAVASTKEVIENVSDSQSCYAASELL